MLIWVYREGLLNAGWFFDVAVVKEFQLSGALGDTTLTYTSMVSRWFQQELARGGH